MNWRVRSRADATRMALLAFVIVFIAIGAVAGSELVADDGGPAAPFERYLADGVDDVPVFPGDPPQPSLGSRTTNSYAPLSVESVAASGTEILGADELIIPASQISPLGAFDSSDANAIPTLTRSIAGITDAEAAANEGSGGIPPDPMLAVGPDHVVTVVNTSYEIHDKEGNQLASEAFSSFFSGLWLIGTPFDPKVRYDQYRNRFIMIAIDGRSSTANQSQILIAVSDDSNPVGIWHKSKIDSVINIGGTNHWADFPGIGMDADALFITNNMFEFDADGGDFGGQRLWIVDKDSFYGGGTLTSTIHDPWTEIGAPEFAITTIPSHAFGSLPGNVGTFMVAYAGFQLNNGEPFIDVIRVDDPLGTPSFNDQFFSIGAATDDITAALPNAPQSGSSATIETNQRRVLDVVWRSNLLWAVFTILGPTGTPDSGQSTAHWVKIDTSDLSNVSLVDQGNAGGNDIDSTAHTFFPSIIVDSVGNMAMSFALSSSNDFSGAFYTGRLASDPAGTTRNTGVLRAGVATYDATNIGFSGTRWGDYSGIALDPSNEREFWAFNEFARTTDRWGTHIGRFSFADTPSSPQSVSATVNVALAEATVTWSAPSDDGGLPITKYLVLSTPDSLSTTTSATTTQTTISGLTRGIAYTFTVTPSNNQGPGATSSASNSVTASSVPDPPTGVAATAGVNSASVSWTAPADDGGTIIVDFTVTSNPDGIMVASTSTSATVNGLTADTSYTFTVTARNFIGNSSSSVPSTPVTTHAVPDAPTGFTAVAKVDSADVTCSAPGDDGGSPITLYTVTSAPEGIIATTTATSTTVTGLTNGTSYTFSVIATNAVGNSAPSATSSGVAPGPGIVFDPALIVLVDVADFATTTIVVQAVDPGTDRIIAYLQVPAELTVSLISCGGIFAGATTSTSTVPGGTLVECDLSGIVSTTSGAAIELTVTRAATSTATITFNTGATSTAFFVGGATTTPVVHGELTATEGIVVNGTLGLQGVSSTSSFAVVAPQITLISDADPTASTTESVDENGQSSFASVPPGTYDVVASASAYLPANLEDLQIGLADQILSPVTLLAGRVNADANVNLTDVLKVIAAFGTSPPRPNGSGDFTDVNGDGNSNLTDVLITISNFGRTGPQPWQ